MLCIDCKLIFAHCVTLTFKNKVIAELYSKVLSLLLVLAHMLYHFFSLYFLHFQQFAKLKHTHLLNQGHHLEHDQDYEICNLSLSEQNASR